MEENKQHALLEGLALLMWKDLFKRWEKATGEGTLLLDEGKAELLFPWLISTSIDPVLLEDELGLYPPLLQQLRALFPN